MKKELSEQLRSVMAKRQVMIDKEVKHYEDFMKAQRLLGRSDEDSIELYEEYEQPLEFDELGKNIIKLIKEHHAELSVEDILEGLDSLGYAPSLINNDIGHWAIGTDGSQELDLDFEDKKPEDDADFGGGWWLKRSQWSPTIRGAIELYFEKEEDYDE